jgi:hypothetical protein
MTSWTNPDLGTAVIAEHGPDVLVWTATRWSGGGGYYVNDYGPNAAPAERFALLKADEDVRYFATAADAMRAAETKGNVREVA